MGATELPPRSARRLLDRLRRYAGIHLIHGDLEDEFQVLAARAGRRRAVLWYWSQVLFAFWSNLINSAYFGGIMFKNYLRVAFRIIRRHKGFSFIKIFGLAVGMACCILILLYVRFELSFDNFHTEGDRVYRILSELELAKGREVVSCTALPVAPALKDDFQEIERAARLSDGGDRYFRFGPAKFSESLYYADEDFLNILTFPLVQGDPETALVEPYSSIVSFSALR